MIIFSFPEAEFCLWIKIFLKIFDAKQMITTNNTLLYLGNKKKKGLTSTAPVKYKTYIHAVMKLNFSPGLTDLLRKKTRVYLCSVFYLMFELAGT